MIGWIKAIVWHFRSAEAWARHIGVKIGRNCLIDTRKWSSEPYLITIGNNVQVTQDVYFHTHGGAHVGRKENPTFDLFGKIVIEDDVYIGSGSHIMPGVTIGQGALIAAGSIVTKSVPSHEVWGGNPAHKICSTKDYIMRNAGFNTNTKGMSFEKKKQILLSLPGSKFIQK